MLSNQPKINSSITLGNNKDLPLLADITLKITIDAQKAQKTRQSLNIEKYANDLILCLQFCVETGRQKQFIQYMQKGMDQEDKNLSPLQSLFGRPKSSGKVQIKQKIGTVVIVYTFYEQYLEEFIQMIQTIQQIQFQPQINLKIQLKGRVSHNKKNRTTVKVDYAKISTQSDIGFKQLVTLLKSTGAIPQQFAENPLINMLGNLKYVNITLSLESFRKLRRFYKKAGMQQSQIQKKSFPYVTKGLIKDNTRLTLLYKQKYILNVNIKYHSQDIFMRLIKIYKKVILKFNEEEESSEEGE